MTLNPFDFDERSPLAELQLDTPVLQHQGRIFAERLSAGDEAALLRRGGLADLCNLPRFGLRGPAAASHLQGQGYVLPECPNQALRQPTGEWLLRLSQSEYLLLGALADGGTRVTETFDYSRYGPRWAAVLRAVGFPERNRRGIRGTLTRLKAAAESPTPPTRH